MEVKNSSIISNIDYDSTTKELQVKFKTSGEVFKYSEVPPIIASEFENSQSKGVYFHARIKNNYDSELVD